MGKLNVASYNIITQKLALVPIGDASISADDIKTQLDEIYLPYGIVWEVRKEEAFTETSWGGDDGKLDAGESGFFSAYTDEMKALNSAFAEERTVDDEEIYLFVFNSEAANVESGVLLGDMPISSQFGYIFNPDGESIAPKTIAHELGHGMFLLKHTFASTYGIDQGTTDNLMDYSTGTELVKQQWDAIYDPQLTLFAWLQDDEDGAYTTDGINKNTLVFSGDNYQEIITLINDKSVCYFGNTDETNIKLEFKPILEGIEDYPKNLYIKTEIKLDGNIINNTSEVYKAGKDKESGGYTSKNAFSFELESKIAHYDDISIICYWSSDGENNWQKVMEYSPIIYTTLKQAVNDEYGNSCNLDERLLYFTCNLLADNNETSIFNAIWLKIKKLQLNTNDFGLNTGLSIGYYFSGNAANNLEDLFVYNNGICNAFQDLMIQLLQTQGLSASEASISMGTDESFLVKAWEYSETGSSGNSDYPYINYFDLNNYEPSFLTTGKYRWTGTPEVERMPNDANNLGGHNNNKPPANFYTHQVVEYNGRIYDPSYGKDFDNIEKWKEESVVGIYIEEEGRLISGTKANAWLIKKSK